MVKLLVLIINFVSTIICSTIDVPSLLVASQTPLMQAAAEDNVVNLKKLLIEIHDEPLYYLSQENINAQDSQGRTALFIAAQEGYIEIIKVLLKIKNIDINLADEDGMTPLQVAVTNGYIDTVNALLDASILRQGFAGRGCMALEQRDKKLGFTPLARAARSGNTAIIKLLLNAGANPTAYMNQDHKISIAQLYTGEDKEVTCLFESKIQECTKRNQAFFKSLHKRDLDEAKKILILGININAKNEVGTSPLLYAAMTGPIDIAEFLINSKADINVKSGNDNSTPLHLAVMFKNTDIAELLIFSKADVNSRDKSGQIPLHNVADDNKYIVGLLVKYKADVQAKDISGFTPLHRTAMKLSNASIINSKEIVNILIKAGADVNAKDINNNTPLHWAHTHRKEILQLLIDNKADVNAKNKHGKTPADKQLSR